MGWVPQLRGRVRFIRLAIREADEFELHSPWALEINPGLSLAVALALCGFAHDLDVLALEISERRVEVIHIEGEVMSADIRILRLWGLAVGRFVLKDFKVRTVFAPEEPELAHHRSRVHAEVFGHPVILANEGPKAVDQLAANDINEEPLCLIEVRDGKTDVLGAS